MKIGDIVISTYGHDMGDWFVVEQVLNEYVFLVDGKNRPLEKPKKKKVKHILTTKYFAQDIANKMLSKQSIQNAEIRKTLKFFKEQN